MRGAIVGTIATLAKGKTKPLISHLRSKQKKPTESVIRQARWSDRVSSGCGESVSRKFESQTVHTIRNPSSLWIGPHP